MALLKITSNESLAVTPVVKITFNDCFLPVTALLKITSNESLAVMPVVKMTFNECFLPVTALLKITSNERLAVTPFVKITFNEGFLPLTALLKITSNERLAAMPFVTITFNEGFISTTALLKITFNERLAVRPFQRGLHPSDCTLEDNFPRAPRADAISTREYFSKCRRRSSGRLSVQKPYRVAIRLEACFPQDPPRASAHYESPAHRRNAHDDHFDKPVVFEMSTKIVEKCGLSRNHIEWPHVWS